MMSIFHTDISLHFIHRANTEKVCGVVSSAFIGTAICACDSPSFSIGTQQILPQYVRLLSDRPPPQEKWIKYAQTAYVNPACHCETCLTF